MPEQSIKSEDMSLKRVFMDFYSVPDYQREYVWGETNAKGQGGEEVEQFLDDIFGEFEAATESTSPEYFIGTIVVCANSRGIYELIDGQQRVTTAFLTLCCLRDRITDLEGDMPDELPSQIFSSSTDWQGVTERRSRLVLQYEDSRGVLNLYSEGSWRVAPLQGTRSIVNLSRAYQSIRTFLTNKFKEDAGAARRFYGYLTNKVKLIRIETASIAKALKIFETVNDRGVGLDAMDLLKNLLFMSASSEQFVELKTIWKSTVDVIYGVREKPLRFLRYLIFADYDVADSKLQEDQIYDWFLNNAHQTGHVADPLGFARGLLVAAEVYARLTRNLGADGQIDEGLANTRQLGGTAIRQHYILLLAGRHLSTQSFRRITLEVENLMFVYLITNTPTRDYERSIIEGARLLRASTETTFGEFCAAYFPTSKTRRSRQFTDIFKRMYTWDTRAYRMRYLLAKISHEIDIRAYGSDGPQAHLRNYFGGNYDVEHIFPETPSAAALAEFGDFDGDVSPRYRLGNLLLLETPINQVLGNKPYSQKKLIYPQSQLLLVRCQASKPVIGVNDRITRTVSALPCYPEWNPQTIQQRQDWLTQVAHEVWQVPLEPRTAEVPESVSL